MKPGDRFGRWTIEQLLPNYRVWVRCDCGTVGARKRYTILSGVSKSCGCGQVKHGHARDSARHPLYNTWASMLSRCNNPNTINYYLYGGRGISVCERWRKFENFLADMGEKPTKSHSLDRINRNGNYEPGNVRWATQLEQRMNSDLKRGERHPSARLPDWLVEIVHVNLNAGVFTRAQLAQWFGVGKTTLARMARGEGRYRSKQ